MSISLVSLSPTAEIIDFDAKLYETALAFESSFQATIGVAIEFKNNPKLIENSVFMEKFESLAANSRVEHKRIVALTKELKEKIQNYVESGNDSVRLKSSLDQSILALSEKTDSRLLQSRKLFVHFPRPIQKYSDEWRDQMGLWSMQLGLLDSEMEKIDFGVKNPLHTLLKGEQFINSSSTLDGAPKVLDKKMFTFK